MPPSPRRAELRAAITQLSLRGLKRSAQWCAELLCGLPEDEDAAGPAPADPAPPPARDAYLMGKAHLDAGELERCAHFLAKDRERRAAAGFAEDALCSFVRLYATFLAEQRRKEEQLRETCADAVGLVSGGLGGASATAGPGAAPVTSGALGFGAEPGPGASGAGRGSSRLEEVTEELGEMRRARRADGYHLWLLAACVREWGGADALAVRVLLESVQLAPYNWSAWQDLAALVPDAEAYAVLRLPDEDHPAARFFRGGLMVELERTADALALDSELLEEFPRSPFARAQCALAHYASSDYDLAQEWLEAALEEDPHRLTNVDTLSDVLFVKEARAELSHLAHRAMRLDKHRAETCCVVGNYFSLKGQHERAVVYFKRALRQNRRYLRALTLLGHEFIELKNLPAAVEAYRQAVDVNPRDFRAWYGLGQTFEIARMHLYALHYYRKATLLRENDARMWCAMAKCYEGMQRVSEAVTCYKRAEAHQDPEGIAVVRLAELYSAAGDEPHAAAYYYKLLQRRREEGGGDGGGVDRHLAYDADVARACAFLAKFCRNRGRLPEALGFARELTGMALPAEESKEAEALVQDVRNRIVAGAGEPSAPGAAGAAQGAWGRSSRRGG